MESVICWLCINLIQKILQKMWRILKLFTISGSYYQSRQ